jgi:hypothetical protein
MCSGLIWLTVWTSGGSYKHGSGPSDLIKSWEFFEWASNTSMNLAAWLVNLHPLKADNSNLKFSLFQFRVIQHA